MILWPLSLVQPSTSFVFLEVCVQRQNGLVWIDQEFSCSSWIRFSVPLRSIGSCLHLVARIVYRIFRNVVSQLLSIVMITNTIKVKKNVVHKVNKHSKLTASCFFYCYLCSSDYLYCRVYVWGYGGEIPSSIPISSACSDIGLVAWNWYREENSHQRNWQTLSTSWRELVVNHLPVYTSHPCHLSPSYLNLLRAKALNSQGRIARKWISLFTVYLAWQAKRKNKEGKKSG